MALFGAWMTVSKMQEQIDATQAQVDENRAAQERRNALDFGGDLRECHIGTATFVVDIRQLMHRAMMAFELRGGKNIVNDTETREALILEFEGMAPPDFPSMPQRNIHPEVRNIVSQTEFMARKWIAEWKDPNARAEAFSSLFEVEVWAFEQMERYAMRTVFLLEKYEKAIHESGRMPTDEEVENWLSVPIETIGQLYQGVEMMGPSLIAEYQLGPRPPGHL